MEEKLSILEGRRTVSDDVLSKVIWGGTTREDGSTIPHRVDFTPRCKNVPPDLLERTFVGGRACDACGAAREELGVPNVPCCTRCRRAFYCSPECQARHRPVHLPHCRRKRDFRPGDVLKLDFLRTRPGLNGELVRAVEPHGDDRWKVQVLSSRSTISVPRRSLEFIRPPT
jgi:hypothetical protein